MDTLSAVPSHLRPIIQALIGAVRATLEQGKPPHSAALIGDSVHHRLTDVQIDSSSQEAKEVSAALIREVAALLEADFVLAIIDGWGLPSDKQQDIEAILKEYGSIGESPFKVDVFSFFLFTKEGEFAAQTEVSYPSDSAPQRTFGPVEFTRTDLRGIFSDLLPQKPAGPLH